MNPRSHLVSVRNTAKTRASIIIVSRNSTKTLRQCLESVMLYLGQSDEIVIIDNASSDGSPDLIEEIFLSASLDPASNIRLRLRYSVNQSDIGFSRAANQGMAEANGEHFVLLSPDVIVTEGWLDAMMGHLIEPHAGAIGPLIDIGNGPQNAAIFLPEQQVLEARPWEEEDGSNDLLEQVASSAKKRYAGRHKEVRYLFTNCILLPRATVETIGPLDEDLFIGGEDLELSWRLACHGYRLLIAADSVVSCCGDAYFDALPRDQAIYLSQLATNRIAEKIVGHYLNRNETPPGADTIWEIEGFRPSQKAISIAVVSENPANAEETVNRLRSQAAIPVQIAIVDPTPKSLNDFLGSASELSIIIEAGTALGPGWMSRIAAAGDLLSSPAIFFPSWQGYTDQEPIEHGIKPRMIPDKTVTKGRMCFIMSLQLGSHDRPLDEELSGWKEALAESIRKLASEGAQCIEIADLKAKELSS